tara:strand:+ start:2951 stop:3610 length:660 start_codon:yes stop_codon:yes gene_type:complete
MSVSISLQLEATGYPEMDKLVQKTGISKDLYNKNNPSKHLTLSTIIVDFNDLMKLLKKSVDTNTGKIINKLISKKSDKIKNWEIDLVIKLLEDWLNKEVSKFALREIKPIVDEADVIDLEFIELDLWSSGHLIAIFQEDEYDDYDEIIYQTRKFMKRMFKSDNFTLDEDEVVPHLTLAKFDKDDHKKLKRKLKQPSWNVPDYKIISGQWYMYPTIRMRF